MMNRVNMVGTGLMLVLLMMFLIFSLNAGGVTQFPFRTSEPQGDTARLADTVDSARVQCRFGNALLRTGNSPQQTGKKLPRRERLADAYAAGVPGVSSSQRALIRDACLDGLSGNSTND